MFSFIMKFLALEVNTTVGKILAISFTGWLLIAKPWVSLITTFAKGGVMAVIGKWIGF